MATPTDPRLTELDERRQANVGKQIDNARLYAGSPMYYYCKVCGVHVSTKPEGWYLDPPPERCATCKDLLNDGVIDRDANFVDWCKENKLSQYRPAPPDDSLVQ